MGADAQLKFICSLLSNEPTGSEELQQDATSAPPSKRIRKSGEEKAYPQSVLKALKEGTPLFANR